MRFQLSITALGAALFTATFGATGAGAESGTVFVPEGSGNSVLVVRAETGETIRRITGLEAVHGLAGAPGVPYLVAGSYAETDRDTVGAMPAPAAVSGDEHAVHHAPSAAPPGPANSGLSLVSVIDAQSGDILRRIEVPGAVHHTAMSSDGRYAVATHPAGGGISVIDLEKMETVGFVATGDMPNYAVFDPASGFVYVSNTGNGTISEVDLARGIVRRNLIAGAAPEHLALNPGNGTILAADGDAGAVREVALAEGEVRRSFPIGGEIHGIALTPGGGALLVAGRGEDKIASIDLDTGAVRTVTLAPEPYHLTAVPGSALAYVSSSAEPRVWIVDTESLAVKGEFAVEGEGHQIVALP